MIRELRSGEYRHDSMPVRRRPSIDVKIPNNKVTK
jgi:hypothetical protein